MKQLAKGTLGLVTESSPRGRRYQVTGVVRELRAVLRPRVQILWWGFFVREVYQVVVSLSHAQLEGFDSFLGEDARHYSLPSVLTLKMSKEHFERLAVGDEVRIPYLYFPRKGKVERLPLQLKRPKLRRVS